MAMMRMPVRVGVPGGMPGTGIRGMGDAASILADEASYQTGYLASPAFLASQAAALQNECAVSPNSPACQIATITNDVNVGYNPLADTMVNLSDYCSQNLFNNNMFATPLDTATCGTAGKVQPAVVQQAVDIAKKSQVQAITPASSTNPSTLPQQNPLTTKVPDSTTTPATSTITNQPSNASTDLVNKTPSTGAGSGGMVVAGAPDAITTWIQNNWILLAAGAAALVILPMVMKGK